MKLIFWVWNNNITRLQKEGSKLAVRAIFRATERPHFDIIWLLGVKNYTVWKRTAATYLRARATTNNCKEYPLRLSWRSAAWIKP